MHIHGDLEFIAPDTLIMKQSAPHKGVYRIVGNRLFVNQARRGVPVSRYPGVVAIVSGFEGLLSGNQALLAHDFTPLLSGNAQSWQLVLKPRLALLKRALTKVVVEGHEGQFVQVITHAPNGNYAVMRIIP